jgi:ribosomal protein S6--L-glutamate ligase
MIGVLAIKNTYENRKIIDEALSRGLECKLVHPKFSKSDPEIWINRVHRKGERFARRILANGLILNPYPPHGICKDKLRSYNLLCRFTHRLIPTYRPRSDLETLEIVEKNLLDGDLGYTVIKTRRGSRGYGVFRARTRKGAKKILKLIGKARYILQPYWHFVSERGDIRALVVGNKVVGSMLRKGINDWRNNFSLGGRISSYKLSDTLKRFAVQVVKLLGIDIGGVDIAAKNQKNFYLIEVNSTPQWRGLERVINKRPEKEIIDLVEKKLEGILS